MTIRKSFEKNYRLHFYLYYYPIDKERGLFYIRQNNKIVHYNEKCLIQQRNRLKVTQV